MVRTNPMKASRIRSVEIPEEDQGVFASLSRLADPALDGLERALRRATPTLDRNELIQQLQEESALIDVPDLEDIVAGVVSLAGTAYSGQVDVDSFVEVVVDAIRNDHVVDLSKEEALLLTNRLKRLAKVECLEIIAKGNVLLRANDQNFHSASIVSELRPVFIGEELKVSAGLILHQLAIRTVRNGRPETTYFTLDSEDILSLSDAVARAIKKERSLREFANRSATPVLIPPTESEK
jgi:hypothetical protein